MFGFGKKKELNKFVEDYTKLNTVTMDNRDWFFGVALDNGKQRNLFTKSGIHELVIEDDLFSWYTKGYITLVNDEDALERTAGVEKFLDLIGLPTGYKMRSDGRDILSINLSPNIDTVKSFSLRMMGIETKPDEDVFKLSNDYAIYDMTTEYGDGGKQYKKLFFWDLRYQLLLERNVHYSTGLIKNKLEPGFDKKIRQVNNQDRSIKSGKAIQEFIKQSLEDQKPEFDDKLWDEGGANIYYSSPAQYKGINDIDHLLNDHVSSDSGDNDFSILKYDTFTKKWTLIPITKYFELATEGKEAGEYQFDKFQISQHGGNLPWWLSMLSAKPKSPELTISDINSKQKSAKIPLPYAGQTRRKNMIPGESMELEKTSWKFEDLAGVDNQTLLTTYAVHSYNMSTHEFNIDVFKNEIQTVAENFQKQYIEKNFLAEDKPQLNFSMTPGKKEQKVLNNLFTLNNDAKIRAVKGRNQLYKNLIFLNNACTISVKGDTHRRSGRFFSLDRTDNYFDNEFDQKILGQYFVVNVKHVISKETYKTEMLGVKPYRFSKREIEKKEVQE